MLLFIAEQLLYDNEEGRLYKQMSQLNLFEPRNNLLTLPAPILDKEKKINLNFYFHASLWCLKRFYEGF